MKTPSTTPNRSSRTQRRPARAEALMAFLREMDINPPGKPEFELVSRWAAKHVWCVKVKGEPWAYIRYLLGTSEQYPRRWQHLKLGVLLNEARVGPRVLGLTPSSSELDGRAAVVEAALRTISREELEARAVEAVTLIARLHTSVPIHSVLMSEVTRGDHERFQPLNAMFAEVRERWFVAVVERWLEAGLHEIGDLTEIVSDLVNRIEAVECCSDDGELIVPSHNDPNHGNFMVNRQGVLRMIDFEELALNNPVADLGVFLTWYVDREQHREILSHYPLGDPDAILERMNIWVPLRYLTIAAHWAARLTQARDYEGWEFAVKSVVEWLHSSAELVMGDTSPIDDPLNNLGDLLLERWPLPPVENADEE